MRLDVLYEKISSTCPEVKPQFRAPNSLKKWFVERFDIEVIGGRTRRRAGWHELVVSSVTQVQADIPAAATPLMTDPVSVKYDSKGASSSSVASSVEPKLSAVAATPPATLTTSALDVETVATDLVSSAGGSMRMDAFFAKLYSACPYAILQVKASGGPEQWVAERFQVEAAESDARCPGMQHLVISSLPQEHESVHAMPPVPSQEVPGVNRKQRRQ